MPELSNYDQYQGLHWETGSLRNSLAYQGYDPQVQILTRNTFDPLRKIYERLDLQINIHQTASPDKGMNNLLEVLAAGTPAIVFADLFSLPYNALPYDKGMWAMLPILVYGYSESADLVSIADRARVPLTVSGKELAIARGRTKKNKYRLLTLEPPNPAKLQSAVKEGIRNCIQLFTQAPPKGSKNNFGFLAYKKWADNLVKTTGRGSWQQEFPPGDKKYAALTSAFQNITIFGKDGGAEREVYAQFLDEASSLMTNPALKDIAHIPFQC
jgi:hypothetical protein